MKQGTLIRIVIRVVSIIAIVSLSFPGLFNFSMFVDYQLDMDKYIAQCENTDVPMMHCNGKCLLAQKIQQANNENRPEEPSFLSEYSNYLAVAPVSVILSDGASELNWNYYCSTQRGIRSTLLRPPATIS